jgi:hypothetical protein
VVVVLRDGRRLDLRSEGLCPVADARLAAERVRLETKFAGLVEPILGSKRTTLLHDAVDGLENLASVRELGPLLSVP